MATVNLDRKYVDRKLLMNICFTKTILIAERVLSHFFQFTVVEQEQQKLNF